MNDITSIARVAEDFISSGRFVDRIAEIIEDDPWSQPSLDRCESFFLKHINDFDDQLKFEYVLFLGEGLRRCFNGQWKQQTFPTGDGGEILNVLCLYYPHSQHYDIVSNLLDHACDVSTGTTWSAFFKVNQLFLASITSG